MLFRLIRPVIYTLDPERAHRLTVAALSASPPLPMAKPGRLKTTVAGIEFANPLGMAAGFDKDAQVPDQIMGLGFGFSEAGSITPLPQTGNPKPRLFRLTKDQAVINRMGFNNYGAEDALARLKHRKRRGVLGINIGANKDSADRIEDYRIMAQKMAPFADYLAVNISSPNTPGLRALQDEAALADLLDTVLAARNALTLETPPPVFLKVAPDLEPQDIDAIAKVALAKDLGALIVSNTTVTRPSLRSNKGVESGGLSGEPLGPLALQRLRDFRSATGGKIPLIGVGGIGNAEQAWERIRAGASLVQLYTAMVYQGAGIAKRITHDLQKLMIRDGFSSIAEAVGSE